MKIKVVKDSQEGVDYLKKLLYSVVNNKTVLFLSGGKTPKVTYSQLALERKINPGAVAMVDERVGEKMHKSSNEKMIWETGLWSYLEKKKIPFYSVLRLHPKGALDLAKDYDREVKYLLGHFAKSIAIVGIGEDGHTAGLPSGIKNSKIKIKSYVTRIDNFPGEFKERITLTFKALSQMDSLIILVFGSAKQNALKMVFRDGAIEEIPARFYTQPQIAKKTILITDQKI